MKPKPAVRVIRARIPRTESDAVSGLCCGTLCCLRASGSRPLRCSRSLAPSSLSRGFMRRSSQPSSRRKPVTPRSGAGTRTDRHPSRSGDPRSSSHSRHRSSRRNRLRSSRLAAVCRSAPAAPYNPPPVGSVIQTSAGTHTITGSNGYMLQNDQKAGSGFTTLHARWLSGSPRARRATAAAKSRSCGRCRSARRPASAWSTQQGRALSWDVVRAETITVPAGTFATYVIEKRERTSDDFTSGAHVVCAADRLLREYEQELVRGIDHRAPWDLVSIRHPGAPVAAVPGYHRLACHCAPTPPTTARPSAVSAARRRCSPTAAACWWIATPTCARKWPATRPGWPDKQMWPGRCGRVLLLADGRRVAVDCETYVRVEQPTYQAWLAR